MNNILKLVDKDIDQIKSIRHELHQHPELDFDLHETVDIICKYLDEFGIKYKKLVNGSAIIAEIAGKDDKKTIALRADMDALPIVEASNCPFPSKNNGKMHACGHDVHTTILLGIAKILSQSKDQLPCNVRFLFQPAEETTGGAVPMIKEGALDGVSYIYGLHVYPSIDCGQISIEYGPMYASAVDVDIDIKGKSSHGAYPSKGIDAIVVAAYVVTALQTIVSRNTDARDSLVLTFGTINGGTKENIIANEVRLSGTMRALSEDVKVISKDKITALVKNICEGYGAKGEVTYRDSYISLINHDECVDIIRENGEGLLGKENVIEEKMPNMGVEDFAYYVAKIPGAFYHLGVRNEAKGATEALHSDRFNVDEDAIAIGVKIGIMNIFKTYEKLMR